MSDTFHSINLHVVFSTKDRQPLLRKELRDEMFAYMGGVASNRQSVLLHSGGVEDHVHLLIGVVRNSRLLTCFETSRQTVRTG